MNVVVDNGHNKLTDVVEIEEGCFIYLECSKTSGNEDVYLEWSEIDPSLRKTLDNLAEDLREKGEQLRKLIQKAGGLAKVAA